MNKFLKCILATLLLALMLSCHSTQRVSKSNLAYIYQDEETVAHPTYKVYHLDEMSTVLYVRLKSDEVLYSRNNPKKQFSGKLIMHVHVYSAKNNRAVTSDTVFMYENSGPDQNKYLLGEVELKIRGGENYTAEITIDDIHRMQFVQDLLFIDKTNPASEENFLIRNDKGEIQFGNAFDPGSKLTVEHNRDLPSNLQLTVIDPFEKFPPPPFMSTEEINIENLVTSDEMEIVPFDKRHFRIELGEAGIYHLPMLNGDSSKLSLLVFHSYFPYVKTVSSMIGPLRYITTKQEFETLMKSENLKKDIDDFWLKVAGNPEKASEIIELYYSRVEQANKHFTSYTQGWKTDRGLVLIIYGRPTSIAKNGMQENWLYTEKTNSASVEFVFTRSENPLTQNDFVLNRAQGYKSSWYRSIDGWRQGRIYN